MIASTLEYMLLGLLDQSPSSGYDLRKGFVSSPLRNYSDSPGAIYPALRRLTGRGWIDAQAPDGARKRRVFRINWQGHTALISWLKRGVTPDDILRPELLLLRFAFMGHTLPSEDVRSFLDEFAQKLTTYLASLESFFIMNGDSYPLTARLSFEYGLQEYRTLLIWTQTASKSVIGSKKWPMS